MSATQRGNKPGFSLWSVSYLIQLVLSRVIISSKLYIT